jgi:D-sedoheptulose 7-phosphate isomerase
VRDYLANSILAKVRAMEELSAPIAKAGGLITDSLAAGGKWLIFGNGGSAADAQHLATEMVGRLYKLERRGLAALALTTDSSILTSVGNDYGFERVFERQVEALAKRGDVALGISTSGRSPNVLKGLAQAKKMGCKTLALTGGDGGALARAKYVDLCLNVAAARTSHVQETHIAIGHALCFLAEGGLKRRRLI